MPVKEHFACLFIKNGEKLFFCVNFYTKKQQLGRKKYTGATAKNSIFFSRPTECGHASFRFFPARTTPCPPKSGRCARAFSFIFLPFSFFPFPSDGAAVPHRFAFFLFPFRPLLLSFLLSRLRHFCLGRTLAGQHCPALSEQKTFPFQQTRPRFQKAFCSMPANFFFRKKSAPIP